jgi:hypothetical protein
MAGGIITAAILGQFLFGPWSVSFSYGPPINTQQREQDMVPRDGIGDEISGKRRGARMACGFDSASLHQIVSRLSPRGYPGDCCYSAHSLQDIGPSIFYSEASRLDSCGLRPYEDSYVSLFHLLAGLGTSYSIGSLGLKHKCFLLHHRYAKAPEPKRTPF